MNEHLFPEHEENANQTQDSDHRIKKDIEDIKEDLAYLKDLFIRRLSDDKQKNVAIKKLSEGVTYSFIEPFLHDIILLLDRLEKSDDDFVVSVYEELYDVIHRRGVERIEVASSFDPSLHKAIKVIEDPNASDYYIAGVIRNGYMFSGKVLRPTEVIVGRPGRSTDAKEDNE